MMFDHESLKLLAHLDQTRSSLRAMIREIPPHELNAMIRTAASGNLHEFDERTGLLVGMLAIVSIFDLLDPDRSEGA